MASALDTRFEQLLSELARADVSFCVVGSFALAVHGAPRASADIDVVPETSIENLTSLAAVLADLEAALEPGGEAARVSAAEIGAEDVEGIPAFSVLAPNALRVDVGDEQVMFCSRQDLVEMKRASGRLIDRADLERLFEVEADE